MNLLAVLVGVLAAGLFSAGLVTLATLLKGCMVVRRLARERAPCDPALLMRSPLVPGISIVAAPPDASPRSRAFVRRLLNLQYGNFEVVLVLSGPSDEELETWQKEFRLNLIARRAAEDLPTEGTRGVYDSPEAFRLLVVDKEPRGEADTWNAGVNLAGHPLVAIVDEECEFDCGLLSRLVFPMLEDPENVTAVYTSAPAAASGGLIARWAALESLRGWLGRAAAFTGYDLAVPLGPSAVLIDRQSIVDAGGFRAGPLELLAHLHGLARTGAKIFRVVCLPESGTGARAVGTLAGLHARIARDQSNIAGLWWRRKSLAGGAGALGWGLPALLCARGLRPAVEIAAYVLTLIGWIAGAVDSYLAGLVLLSTVGMGVLVSMAAVAFQQLADVGASDPRPPAALFLAAIPENLGYRQLRNLWLMAAVFRAQKNLGTDAAVR
jgi:hypothetical protein